MVREDTTTMDGHGEASYRVPKDLDVAVLHERLRRGTTGAEGSHGGGKSLPDGVP